LLDMYVTVSKALLVRQFLAGKSIEEIKQDALRDMANNQLVNQRLEQQLKPPPSAHNRDSVSGTPHLGAKLLVAGGHADPKLFMMQPTVAVNQLLPHQSSMQPHRTFPVQSHVPVLRITPPQQPTATQGNNSASASTPSTYVRSPLSAGTLPAQTLQKQKAPIPSFLDELKLGYPSKGLSRASSHWWGPATTGNGKDTAIAGALGSEVDQDDTDMVSEVKACTTASALFVRTRKKAAIRGRKVLSHAALRGYGVQRLDAKDAALLRFVFANQLPKQWTAAFPPIT
jgi:hypothetical protein